jgi:hypothetical protein
MADEASAQQAPLKITSISWRHTDSALQKDSADIAHSGDTIEFHAEFENYVRVQAWIFSCMECKTTQRSNSQRYIPGAR